MREWVPIPDPGGNSGLQVYRHALEDAGTVVLDDIEATRAIGDIGPGAQNDPILTRTAGNSVVPRMGPEVVGHIRDIAEFVDDRRPGR